MNWLVCVYVEHHIYSLACSIAHSFIHLVGWLIGWLTVEWEKLTSILFVLRTKWIPFLSWKTKKNHDVSLSLRVCMLVCACVFIQARKNECTASNAIQYSTDSARIFCIMHFKSSQKAIIDNANECKEEKTWFFSSFQVAACNFQ